MVDRSEKIRSKGGPPRKIRSAEATLNNAAYSRCRVLYCRPVGWSVRLPAEGSQAMPRLSMTEMGMESKGGGVETEAYVPKCGN